MSEHQTRNALLAACGLALLGMVEGARALETTNSVTLLATVVIEAGNCGTQTKSLPPCVSPATIGSGIDLVAVALGESGYPNSFSLISDANGLVMGNLPPGSYELRLVRVAGPLSMKVVNFEITPNDIAQLSVRLVARRG